MKLHSIIVRITHPRIEKNSNIIEDNIGIFQTYKKEMKYANKSTLTFTSTSICNN